MKTAGSQDASFLVRGADAGAGRGESLKAGAVVFIEVRERLGSDLYRIAVGPRLLTASSTAFLETGTLLKARVERSGGDLLLRMLGSARGAGDPALRGGLLHDAAATTIRAAGLPVDAASRAALAALLGAGLSPEGAALGRVRRAALRAQAAGREDEAGLVELAARMEAKGLAAEEAALDALALAGDGRNGDREGRGGSPGDRPGGREDGPAGSADGTEESDPASDFDLDRDFARSIPESELPASLAAFIKALALRAGSEGSGTGDSPKAAGEAPTGLGGVKAEYLGLFNHAKARDGAWLLVPFRFALDSVAFAGNFRIQLPYVPGGPGRMQARFDASRGGSSRTYLASLSFGGGARPVLRVAAPEGEDSSRFRSLLAAFEAEMAVSGCAVLRGRADADADRGLDLDA